MAMSFRYSCLLSYEIDTVLEFIKDCSPKEIQTLLTSLSSISFSRFIAFSAVSDGPTSQKSCQFSTSDFRHVKKSHISSRSSPFETANVYFITVTRNSLFYQRLQNLLSTAVFDDISGFKRTQNSKNGLFIY